MHVSFLLGLLPSIMSGSPQGLVQTPDTDTELRSPSSVKWLSGYVDKVHTWSCIFLDQCCCLLLTCCFAALLVLRTSASPFGPMHWSRASHISRRWRAAHCCGLMCQLELGKTHEKLLGKPGRGNVYEYSKEEEEELRQAS